MEKSNLKQREIHSEPKYSEYRHFLTFIEKAKESCKNSGHNIVDHFEDILDMIEKGKKWLYQE